MIFTYYSVNQLSDIKLEKSQEPHFFSFICSMSMDLSGMPHDTAQI